MKKLILPVCAVLLAAIPVTSSAKQTYKVRKGDSLYEIAKAHNISVEDLKKANKLASTRLKPGVSLTIPSKARKATEEARPGEAASKHDDLQGDQAPSASPEASAPGTHRVEKGDTLHSISRKYAVSVKDLRALNHLRERSTLKVGSELTLRAGEAPSAANKAPESAPPSESRYTVQKGDTAWGIARKFHLTVDQLTSLNNATADGLKVGQELVVRRAAEARGPRDATSAKPSESDAAASSKAESETIREAPRKVESSAVRVVVKRGDTLKSLARKYALSVEELRELNGLAKKQKLKPGATLIVKKGSPAEKPSAQKTYVVKRGDTLRRIAKKFHTSPDELARLNGLGRRGVKVGQRIVVAAAEEPAGPEAQAALAERREAEARLDSDLKNLSDAETERVSLKDRAIRIARRMLDIPYKFGGNSIRGIDCSAYVQKVFRFLNVPLPRTAREQFNHGLDVPREELATGDLVFFKTYAHFPSHVGIYLGNNKFIHASSVGKKVTIDSLEAPYYSKRFIGGKRLVHEDEAPAQQPAERDQTDQSAG